MIRPTLFTSFAAIAFAFIACSTPSPDQESASSSGSPPPAPPPSETPGEPGYSEDPLSEDEQSQIDPDVAEGKDIPESEVEKRTNPELAASLAYARENGARARFDWNVDRFASLAVLRIVSDVPAAGVQQSPTGGSYLVHDTGSRRIIVSSGGMPPEPPTDEDVVVYTSGPLDDVRIEQRFERSPTAGAGGTTETRLAQVVAFSKSGTQLGLTNHGKPSAKRDCIAEAWAEAPALPPMTVVNPDVRGCDIDRCVRARRAWLVAQHDLMRAHQMLEFIGEQPAEQRAFFWKQRGYGAVEKNIAGTSPEEWFGPYSAYRFDAVRQVVYKLYTSFKTGEHYSSGATLKLICPDKASNGGDLCFTKKPSAHHAVVGQIAMCGRFFDETQRDNWDRARLMSHEVLHHTFVSWNNGLPRKDPVRDIHYHAHGGSCALDPITSAQYGVDRIEHLRDYVNSKGDDCHHRNIAFKNNDTYAYFVRTLGEALLSKRMNGWPMAFPPKEHSGTDNPPEGCNGGGLNPPPPGMDWQDPSTTCQKQGMELVCPSTGGGGGFGGIPNNLLDLKIECPEN